MDKSFLVDEKLRLEQAVVQCIKDWATAYPEELVVFDRCMKQLRDQAKTTCAGKVRGMGPDNNLLHKAEIPANLFYMMSRRLKSKDWVCDPTTRNIFFRHFKVGLVNKFSESKK